MVTIIEVHKLILDVCVSLITTVDQWFSNLSWGPPPTAYFVYLSHLTHLIQLISSLVESARLELGVACERDIQNVWWLGVPRTGLRTTAVDENFFVDKLFGLVMLFVGLFYQILRDLMYFISVDFI